MVLRGSLWFSVKQSRVQHPASAGQCQSLITQSYTEKTQSCTEKKFYHFVILRGSWCNYRAANISRQPIDVFQWLVIPSELVVI